MTESIGKGGEMPEFRETRRIVARRRPDLVPVVDRLVGDMGDDDDVDQIQLVLVDELLEFGLDDQGQHSEYGRHVELLIDGANRARPEFRPGADQQTPI